jgi:hypothetical protein
MPDGSGRRDLHERHLPTRLRRSAGVVCPDDDKLNNGASDASGGRSMAEVDKTEKITIKS